MFLGCLQARGSNFERVQAWRRIMGGRTQIPLVSPEARMVRLDGQEAWVYFVDLRALSGVQYRRLVRYLVQRFEATEREVSEALREVGCPVIREDVIVSIFGVN